MLCCVVFSCVVHCDVKLFAESMSCAIGRLVNASNLPLSVIIIGVGEADFKQMEQLDGDGGVLRSNGEPAKVCRRGPNQRVVVLFFLLFLIQIYSIHLTIKRDIVQFVPLRDYRNGNMSQLARDTLVEVPKQFLTHMKTNKVAPLPPRRVRMKKKRRKKEVILLFHFDSFLFKTNSNPIQSNPIQIQIQISTKRHLHLHLLLLLLLLQCLPLLLTFESHRLRAFELCC